MALQTHFLANNNNKKLCKDRIMNSKTEINIDFSIHVSIRVLSGVINNNRPSLGIQNKQVNKPVCLTYLCIRIVEVFMGFNTSKPRSLCLYLYLKKVIYIQQYISINYELELSGIALCPRSLSHPFPYLIFYHPLSTCGVVLTLRTSKDQRSGTIDLFLRDRKKDREN